MEMVEVLFEIWQPERTGKELAYLRAAGTPVRRKTYLKIDAGICNTDSKLLPDKKWLIAGRLAKDLPVGNVVRICCGDGTWTPYYVDSLSMVTLKRF